MSKELKIIKDLKQRNDRLKNQYMQEQVRNYHLNCVIDKYKSVLDEIREILTEYQRFAPGFLNQFRIDLSKCFEILDKVNYL